MQNNIINLIPTTHRLLPHHFPLFCKKIQTRCGFDQFRWIHRLSGYHGQLKHESSSLRFGGTSRCGQEFHHLNEPAILHLAKNNIRSVQGESIIMTKNQFLHLHNAVGQYINKETLLRKQS